MRARILPLLIAALVVAGCGRGPAEPERPVVALVMKSLANEFFHTMEEGARAHQKEHADAYELVAVGIKDELGVAQQIALVEQMIARRVQAIVLAPADSKALVTVVERAQQAGVVVVNIDNRLDREVLATRGLSVPFVGPDNRAGARAVGAHVAADLPEGTAVAIIEGAPNAFNGVQRKLGFEDAAREAGLKIVRSQSGHWETARANQVASAILTELPDVKALLCANDSMALGAVAAVRASGKAGQVAVAGFDNISAVQELIRSGDVVATADQHGGLLAVYGIEHALSLLEARRQGREVEAGDRETPVDLITRETLR